MQREQKPFSPDSLVRPECSLKSSETETLETSWQPLCARDCPKQGSNKGSMMGDPVW